MELENFITEVQPKGMRSRMWPLRAQILKLEAMDYAYWQIVLWLQMKGIDVSLKSLKEFIGLRQDKDVNVNVIESRTGVFMSEIKGILVRPATGPAVIASNEASASELKRTTLDWAFKQAHASSCIEGHIPDPDYLADCAAVIAGTMTMDQLRAASLVRALVADSAAADIGDGNGT